MPRHQRVSCLTCTKARDSGWVFCCWCILYGFLTLYRIINHIVCLILGLLVRHIVPFVASGHWCEDWTRLASKWPDRKPWLSSDVTRPRQCARSGCARGCGDGDVRCCSPRWAPLNVDWLTKLARCCGLNNSLDVFCDDGACDVTCRDLFPFPFVYYCCTLLLWYVFYLLMEVTFWVFLGLFSCCKWLEQWLIFLACGVKDVSVSRAVLSAVCQCGWCWASLETMQSMHCDVMPMLVTFFSSLSATCLL